MDWVFVQFVIRLFMRKDIVESEFYIIYNSGETIYFIFAFVNNNIRIRYWNTVNFTYIYNFILFSELELPSASSCWKIGRFLRHTHILSWSAKTCYKLISQITFLHFSLLSHFICVSLPSFEILHLLLYPVFHSLALFRSSFSLSFPSFFSYPLCSISVFQSLLGNLIF